MTTGLGASRPRLSPRLAAGLLAAALAALFLLQLAHSSDPSPSLDLGSVLHGIAATLGLVDPLAVGSSVESGDSSLLGQEIFELRLWRTLTAAGVGALLALAGALLQGLFRNGLASPSLIGVTAGANLGAFVAMLALSGHAHWALWGLGDAGPWLVTLAALAGALGVSGVVVVLGLRGPRPSVATLLLVGVAINTLIAGLLSALQDLVLGDNAAMTALQSWTFGNLESRQLWHAGLVGVGLLVSVPLIPMVATELDLLASGEDDARALGVATHRTRILVLFAAAVATASAVASAGQIGFVGLVIPHMVRALVGSGHRAVLPLSVLAGAVFLLACDLAQVLALGERRLHPGVLMSLIGGPMFLWILLAGLRRSRAW